MAEKNGALAGRDEKLREKLSAADEKRAEMADEAKAKVSNPLHQQLPPPTPAIVHTPYTSDCQPAPRWPRTPRLR